jgi:hypothetical protein
MGIAVVTVGSPAHPGWAVVDLTQWPAPRAIDKSGLVAVGLTPPTSPSAVPRSSQRTHQTPRCATPQQIDADTWTEIPGGPV